MQPGIDLGCAVSLQKTFPAQVSIGELDGRDGAVPDQPQSRAFVVAFLMESVEAHAGCLLGNGDVVEVMEITDPTCGD